MLLRWDWFFLRRELCPESIFDLPLMTGGCSLLYKVIGLLWYPKYFYILILHIFLRFYSSIVHKMVVEAKLRLRTVGFGWEWCGYVAGWQSLFHSSHDCIRYKESEVFMLVSAFIEWSNYYIILNVYVLVDKFITLVRFFYDKPDKFTIFCYR